MDWSKQINLVFNSNKTKIMISLTPQVGRIHNLGNPSTYALITSDKILERVSRYKILKIFFSENLSWNKQANKVTSILLHITNIILQVHCTLKLQEEPRRIFSSVSLWKCWVCQHPQIFDKTTETGRKRCCKFCITEVHDRTQSHIPQLVTGH